MGTLGKSLQYAASTTLILKGKKNGIKRDYLTNEKVFPIVKRFLTPEGLATDQVLIKITPERIYFSDYSKGTGHREKLTTF